jgi:hypothetical protein
MTMRITRRDALKTGTAAAVGLALAQPLVGRAEGDLITKAVPSTGEELPVIGLGTNAYSVNTPEEMAPVREVLDHMHDALHERVLSLSDLLSNGRGGS